MSRVRARGASALARFDHLSIRAETRVQGHGKPPRSPCPLHPVCPRWNGPDDYTAAMDETLEQTERRRASWPCSRLLDLLSPELDHIGGGNPPTPR